MTIRGGIIIVLVFTLLAAAYWWSNKEGIDKKDLGIHSDYDGDDYEGTYSYVGDYNSYTDEKGRFPAYKQTTSLYKVIEPNTNVLKYERNKNGELVMLKTGKAFRNGAQVNVLDWSIQKPVSEKGAAFVQMKDGQFINFKKISRV